jgi:hypothetical protein
VNRAYGALLALCCLAVTGCGAESKSYSDGEISDGLALKADGNDYLVATEEEPKGDAFCIVSDLLNDADEVDGAPDGAAKQALSSREGNAGVVVSTELGFPCEEEVQRNLNRLDPKPKDD